MHPYGSLADDFYSNMILNTEMELPAGRDTVLGFCERVQRTYPSMRNFYTRDHEGKGTSDFVLEEDKDQGHQRWLNIERRRICSGYINPTDVDAAMEQHTLVLELIPYMLSVSPLDCEALDFTTGFDFNYRGNHDELVAEALGMGSRFDPVREIPGVKVLNFEPSFTLSLEENCRRQARLMIETRTSAYQVRRGEFPEEQISVYFTIRQYGSLDHGTTYEQTLLELKEKSDELMDEFVISQVLQPLAQAISLK
ncbi:hypothetical protein Pla110_31900 [Polystyrenella longa]|uniref:TIGR04255 family protein n=1 Tax=Polystyrenella longa TaxID=2528007 RepID=A0A518CQE5_9PLAN|nr:hypothetical protein [Polystyrenella longa]QDU81449.1 hypothetical protein Pla110_31900 [Polystyrenella longa]